MAVRDRQPPPADSPSTEHPDLAEPRETIDKMRIEHLDVIRRVSEIHEGLYSIDLMLTTALSRSYSLVEGFISAFDRWNFFAAAPLLRMQADTLVRLSYMSRAKDSEKVARDFISGVEFRNMRDPEGKRLVDWRLNELASPFHPWIENIYPATSGWVHFSPQHFHASWKLDKSTVEPGTQGKIQFQVPMASGAIPEDMVSDILEAMIGVTSEVFAYAELWASRKGLPSGEMRDLPQ